MTSRIPNPSPQPHNPIELPLTVPDDGEESVTVDAVLDDAGQGWVRIELNTDDETVFFDLKPTEARMIGGALRTAAKRAATHKENG